MTMKIICAYLMVLLFSASVALPVFAQDQSDHQPPGADDIVVKMTQKLSLTADQVTAITPIIEKYSSKREELRQSMEDGTADKDSVRSQMKQLKTDENQELSQVLSADQMSQWEQMQVQGRHKHGSGENGGGSWGSSGGNSESGGSNSGGPASGD